MLFQGPISSCVWKGAILILAGSLNTFPASFVTFNVNSESFLTSPPISKEISSEKRNQNLLGTGEKKGGKIEN